MPGIINNDHIRELCNNLVLAVEQDVKQRLLSRWQNEMSFQTGMHGEPLEPVARQRANVAQINLHGGRVLRFINCIGPSRHVNMG